MQNEDCFSNFTSISTFNFPFDFYFQISTTVRDSSNLTLHKECVCFPVLSEYGFKGKLNLPLLFSVRNPIIFSVIWVNFV